MKEQRIKVPKGESDNLETPPWLFQRLNRSFNFDRDVACSSSNALARPVGDAFHDPWGWRNWLNPPYSDPGPFLREAFRKQLEGRTTVALIKGDPSTRWWNDWVKDQIIYWFPRRIRFYYHGLPTSNTGEFASTLVIFLPNLYDPTPLLSVK